MIAGSRSDSVELRVPIQPVGGQILRQLPHRLLEPLGIVIDPELLCGLDWDGIPIRSVGTQIVMVVGRAKIVKTCLLFDC